MRRALLATFLAAVLAATTARAVDEPPTTSGRTVNGHVFMPSLVIPPPLAVGSFSVAMLLGTGGASGPTYDSGGNVTGTKDYTYAALGQQLSYEFAFLKNFTGRLNVLTSLYTGIDGPSILVVGTTVRLGGGAGLTWSFPLGDQFRLGASVDVNYSPQLNLLVAAAVLAALQSPPVYDPSLAFQQNNVFTWIPAVTAAWAPGSAVGFSAVVGFTGSTLTAPGKTYERDAVAAGVLGEVDFGKFTPVDVGLNFAFRKNFGINSSQSNITDVGGALLYTGKPDVALGLEVLARTLTIRPQLPDPLKTTFPIAQIYVRYFWL